MNKINVKLSLLAVGLMLQPAALQAWWASNAGMPYDVFERSCSPCRMNIDWDAEERTFHLSGGSSMELFFDCHGRDKKGRRVGTYQIYSPKDSQSNPVEPYGAFFQGSDSPTEDIDFAERFHGLANTDFGDVRVEGRRSELHMVNWFSMGMPFNKIPGTVRMSAYLPVKFIQTGKTSLASINATNVTGLVNLKPSDLENAIKKVANLNTSHWTNNNVFGDLSLMLSWYNVFDQDHDVLRKVGLMAQAGITIPVANNKVYDNIYAIPLGADGAFGMPLSLSVDAYLYNNVRLLGSADIYYMFDHTGLRRLKKYAGQGEMLLPEIVKAKRGGGTLFRLTGTMEWTSNSKLIWGGVGYQFGKKTESKLSTNDSAYSHSVINGAERWQESEYHSLIGHVGLDLTEYLEKYAPCINFSLRYPLTGKRIALFKAIGVELVISL